MSQRTRRSLVAAAAASPSTPQRATKNKSLTEAPIVTTPQRLTRKSLAQVEAATEVNTPTRRTRTSSVSSVLSDVSEAISESGRVTRRSTRLSGIKLEEPAELPPSSRKRTSSVSSETPSQITKSTRKSLLSKDVPHEDSPFKVSSTRKSRKLSLTTVDENEVETTEDKVMEKILTKLNADDLEQILFSSDDEETTKKVSNRGRKSILPGKSECLNTINEDEGDDSEIGLGKVKELKALSQKSPKSPKKELLEKHFNDVKTPEANKSDGNEEKNISPSVVMNRIDSKDVSPSLVLDRIESNPDKAEPTTPKGTGKSIGKESPKIILVTENEKSPEPITPKGKRKSNENEAQPKNKEETPKNVLDSIITPSSRKRMSTENLNAGGTPKKSLGNIKEKEEKQKEINFEEVILEDDDIVMEDVSAETINTSKTSKPSPEKRVSFGDLKQTEEPKAVEVIELEEAGDKESDVNNAPSEETSQETPKSPKRKRETSEERLERIRLEKAILVLIGKRQKKLNMQKRKHRSEKNKIRQKERLKIRRLAKNNKDSDMVKKGTVTTETIQIPADNPNKDDEVNEEEEQRKVQRIMEKRRIKTDKWMKRLAKKKAEDEAKKREQKALEKTERQKTSEQALKDTQSQTTNLEKKQKNKKKRGQKTEALDNGSKDQNSADISLSDIVAKLDEMTQPQAKKVLAESNEDNYPDEVTRGKAKSGRWWKESKDKFSTMVKTPGLRRPHSEKEKLRAEIKHNKEMTRHILETQAQAKEEHRQRRAENIKRREENAKKAEIVQVIKNPAKLKRMRKKQLRMIEKRDTLPIIEKKKSAAAAAES